jgi:hypothetical protein
MTVLLATFFGLSTTILTFSQFKVRYSMISMVIDSVRSPDLQVIFTLPVFLGVNNPELSMVPDSGGSTDHWNGAFSITWLF